ncbi:HTH-type transcriptional repressor KstR2 [compost metagenome]
MPKSAFRDTPQTEQAIRTAAVQLISKIGYESMSLRQLATQAGVNPGTLYLYYQGKKELLASLVLGYLEELLHAWRQSKPMHSGADMTLQAFVDFHVRYHLLRKEQGVLGNMELRSLDSEDLQIVRQARRAYLREIQAIIEQGVGEGLFDCDQPKLLAHILFNTLTHACSWYRADGPLSVDEIVAQYSQLALRMAGRLSHPKPNLIRLTS